MNYEKGLYQVAGMTFILNSKLNLDDIVKPLQLDLVSNCRGSFYGHHIQN